jgi:Tfp pilus assembly protein FimT
MSAPIQETQGGKLLKLKRRHCVTLLEMLLVLVILGLVAGVIGVNINKALYDQHFRTEVNAVVEKLRIAQNLMLILNTDVHVKFAEQPDHKGIHYWIETNCPLSESWGKFVLKKSPPLYAIRRVDFKDEKELFKQRGAADIQFLSGGYTMSRGVLRLAASELTGSSAGALERYVDLPGYPAPLKVLLQKPSEDAAQGNNENGSKMTMYTVNQIIALKQRHSQTNQEDEEQKPENRKSEDTKPTTTTASSPKEKSAA